MLEFISQMKPAGLGSNTPVTIQERIGTDSQIRDLILLSVAGQGHPKYTSEHLSFADRLQSANNRNFRHPARRLGHQ